MRSIEIWLSTDSRVYAYDRDSGSVFWLPKPLHDGYPPSVQRAVAFHDATIMAEYMAWLDEAPDENVWSGLLGDEPPMRDGGYRAHMVYPRRDVNE